MNLCLVIFDVDGTLVDSQGHIMAAMRGAFSALDLPAPGRSEVLALVGGGLEDGLQRLAPGADTARLAAAYRESFAAYREHGPVSPLYPGTAEMLASLAAQDEVLLALATGKSRRGLDALLEEHDWHRLFVSHQSADEHPSKPHPSMIEQIVAETGVEEARTVMVGDTSYDIEMARNAGVPSIAVPWGYHSAERLGAECVIAEWAELPATLEKIWSKP